MPLCCAIKHIICAVSISFSVARLIALMTLPNVKSTVAAFKPYLRTAPTIFVFKMAKTKPKTKTKKKKNKNPRNFFGKLRLALCESYFSQIQNARSPWIIQIEMRQSVHCLFVSFEYLEIYTIY